jgi:hypothetical protein
VAMDQQVNVTRDTPKPIVLKSLQPNGTDSDVNYNVITRPSKGILTGNGESLLYIPASGYTGTDSFKFKVTNGRTESNIGTVRLTVTENVQVVQKPAAGGSPDRVEKVDNKTTQVKTPPLEEELQQAKRQAAEQSNTDRIRASNDSGSTQQSSEQDQESQSSPPPPDQDLRTNRPLRADAGTSQEVEQGKLVVLDGSKSNKDDGKVVSYIWEQILGPKVDLEQSTELRASFIAPSLSSEENLIFTLTVTDDLGRASTDSVRVKVLESADNFFNQSLRE